jgi:hypothetical protein
VEGRAAAKRNDIKRNVLEVELSLLEFARNLVM